LRETGILGNRSLTFAELERLFGGGARLEVRAAGVAADGDGTGHDVPLFAVSAGGRLRIAADGRPLGLRDGDTVVVLVPSVVRARIGA
jgi:hypothetical protein